MEHIENVMNYLKDQLEGYIDCCGENDDVNVEPCRKAIAELEKARMDQEALIEALDNWILRMYHLIALLEEMQRIVTRMNA